MIHRSPPQRQKKSVCFKTKLFCYMSPQLVTLDENEARLFARKYLFSCLTNIIIHDSAQMAVVSKQMCNPVLHMAALQFIY